MAKTPLEQLNEILSKKKVSSTMTTLGHDEVLNSKVKTFLPSGVLTLDVIMGGGWPIGRVVEVFGHEASGKSMLAAMACAQTQKLGYLATYLDVESAVDQEFFESLDVDLNSLFYTNPESVDDVFSILEGMLEFKAKHYSADHPMIVVWDSVAATTTQDERERGWENKGYSTAAIYISAAFRKLAGQLGENSTLFFLINQIRSNVGVMFGESVTTYGGKAPKFYSSIRLKLDEESKEKVGEAKQRKRVVGENLRVECVKNKIVAPYRSCLLPLSLLTGEINEAESVLTMLKELGLAHLGGGGNYRILIDLETITFKKSDVPELIATYKPQLIELLNRGWLQLPAQKEENEQD